MELTHFSQYTTFIAIERLKHGGCLIESSRVENTETSVTYVILVFLLFKESSYHSDCHITYVAVKRGSPRPLCTALSFL